MNSEFPYGVTDAIKYKYNYYTTQIVVFQKLVFCLEQKKKKSTIAKMFKWFL